MSPVAVASRVLRSDAVVGSLGPEGNEVSGSGGLGVIRRVVVAGDARFVVPLVLIAHGICIRHEQGAAMSGRSRFPACGT